MIKNYILSTLRILTKEKLYTFINAIGLSVSLATCFLIYSWVRNETSYDTYFEDSAHVYRIVTKWDESTDPGRATTYPMIRTRVLPQIPEVETSVRVFDRGVLGSKTRIGYKDKIFTDSKFYYADSTFFKVFPFRFVEGDASSALLKPNAIVITEQTALKYFGQENPVGKLLTIGDGKEFEVTGVIENIPANMHFHFDLIASMLAHPWIQMSEENVWSGIVFHTYVKLKNQAVASEVEKKITYILDHFPNDPDGYGKGIDLHLQPVQDIHLKSAMNFELEANGSSSFVYLFVSIAVLVLLMAVINYTNLAGARHIKRFKEVGVRKVMGASRQQLITQFVTESMIVSSIGFAAALIWIGLVKSLAPAWFDIQYSYGQVFEAKVVFSFVVITLVVGLLTGVSPAIALSAFQPVKLFKSNITASGGITLRKVLMISQFTISIALTICTAVTYKQVDYLKQAKLGYNLDHTLVLNIGYREVQSKYELLKTRLSDNQHILGATATSQLPTDVETEENIDISSSQSLGVNYISVDRDFFRVMGVGVKQGESLINSLAVSDTINQFVLNESAAAAIGWSEHDAVNKYMSIRHGNQHRGAVKGVVSDFHFQSLHHSVGPLVMEFNPSSYQYLLVRVKNEDLPSTIDFVAKQWKEVAAGIPFDYMFLDQEYNRLYKSEIQTNSLFVVFASMAILISLLGLFGLSSFAVERRTKEIGLRKILGASNSTILKVVSKDFIVLLIISFALALPIGYYFMNVWLAHFAFKASIDVWLFMLAGSVNVILGLLTLFYHSLRIAETNPVDTLRYE